MRLIFAAEGEHDVSYMKVLNDVEKDFPNHFRYFVKLNKPPLGWTEGVGFIELHDINKTHLLYPPQENDLVVMCGSPIFENAMSKLVQRTGFESEQWFSFSKEDRVSAK